MNDFECIQACIKSRTGIGHHIPIHFVMESQNLASDQVLYDYQRVGSQIKQKLLQRAKTQIPLKDLNEQVELYLQEEAPADYCLR